MSNESNNFRRFAFALLALMLPITAVACGSDDDSSSGDDGADQSTTAASGDGSSSADDTASDDTGSDDTASDDTASDDTADDSEEGIDGDVGAPVWNCEADPENLSGSSTVLFGADVDFGPTEADITAEVTAVVAADGSGMEPRALTVKANTMFGIEMAEDASMDGVIIGCAGGQTAIAGQPVGFLITEPGTYPVSLDIAGIDIGTIVVE